MVFGALRSVMGLMKDFWFSCIWLGLIYISEAASAKTSDVLSFGYKARLRRLNHGSPPSQTARSSASHVSLCCRFIFTTSSVFLDQN